MSPYELYFEKKPNLGHLRVFDNIAYVHVPKEKRRKLDAKAEKCILVGHLEEQNGYKCYNPQTKYARVSRNVLLDESTLCYLPSSPTPENSEPITRDEDTLVSSIQLEKGMNLGFRIVRLSFGSVGRIQTG